jgi:hypothetical protein
VVFDRSQPNAQGLDISKQLFGKTHVCNCDQQGSTVDWTGISKADTVFDHSQPHAQGLNILEQLFGKMQVSNGNRKWCTID